MSILDIFKFINNGEDDGTRLFDEGMHVVCNRCGTRMRGEYDPDKGVDYYICPDCGFIEIDSYDDEYDENDHEDNDYEDIWESEEEDEEGDIYK